MTSLKTLRDSDAILDQLVERLARAGDQEWVPYADLRAAGWSDPPPKTVAAMLSRKLGSLRREHWVQTRHTEGGTKEAQLTPAGRVQLGKTRWYFDHKSYTRGAIEGRIDLWRSSAEVYVEQATTRTRFYTFAAIRDIVRSDVFNELSPDECQALYQLVRVHTTPRWDRKYDWEGGERPPALEFPDTDVGWMLSFVDAVLRATLQLNSVSITPNSGGAHTAKRKGLIETWQRLVDPAILCQERLARHWFPVWGGLAASVAASQGGSRMRLDDRHRVLDRVLTAADSAGDDLPTPTSRGITLHWRGLSARTRGYADDAADSWREIGKMDIPEVKDPDVYEDLRVAHDIADANVQLVHIDQELRDSHLSDAWVRYGIGGSAPVGPLGLHQVFEFIDSEWSTSAALPGEVVRDVKVPSLEVPSASPDLKKLGDWLRLALRWLNDKEHADATVTRQKPCEKLWHIAPMSLHNQFPFPLILAHARSPEPLNGGHHEDAEAAEESPAEPAAPH